MKRLTVFLLLALAAVVHAAPSILLSPSGPVAVGDVVTLVATEMSGPDDPQWSATGGDWCQSPRCEWRLPATETIYGNVMYWRASEVGSVVITLTNQSDSTTATHTVSVEN